MTDQSFSQLNHSVRAVLTDQQSQWLDNSLNRLVQSEDLVNDLLFVTAGAQRILRDTRLSDTSFSIDTIAGPMTIDHWSCSDTGRLMMIIKSGIVHPDLKHELIESVFQYGDENEIASLIRGFVLMDTEGEMKSYLTEAGRTNSKILFSAIAHSNPYPATFYTDDEFNQLVLKALFMGIQIEQVFGLQQRANAELSRMCEDFSQERLAASRPLPSDIWLAMEPFASPWGYDLMVQYLSCDDPVQRYYSAMALSTRKPVPPQRLRLLKKRRNIESSKRILAMLNSF